MSDALIASIKAIPTTPEKQPALTPAGQFVFVWDVPKGATMARVVIQRNGANCRFGFVAENWDGKEWVVVQDTHADPVPADIAVEDFGVGWDGLVGILQIRVTITSDRDATFGVSAGFQ